MPIAAVPAYLGDNFKHAPPGLRFGMLLPIWTNREDQEKEVKTRAKARSREGQEILDMLQHLGTDKTIHCLRDENYCRQHRLKLLPALWAKNDFAARQAWNAIKVLNPGDREHMANLAVRQSTLAATVPADSLFYLKAAAIAPFTTGLGNEHPLENGFAFLNPYGLPYLPGSGVKGVLRQAALELASGQWGDTKGWSEHKHYRINVGTPNQPRRLELTMLDVLFGRETPSGESDHVRGALSFWDVIPQIAGNSLLVEVMTPHQSHYYQQKGDKKSGDSISPHDSGQPNPICFLTVPPGSGFTFHVVCDPAHLARLTQDKLDTAPDLLANGTTHWKRLLESAFQHAFQWLGFGAKTAVGYGHLRLVGGGDQPQEGHFDQNRPAQKQDVAPQTEVSRSDKGLETDLASDRLAMQTFKGPQDRSRLDAILKKYETKGLPPDDRQLVAIQLLMALPKHLQRGKLADRLRTWGGLT